MLKHALLAPLISCMVSLSSVLACAADPAPVAEAAAFVAVEPRADFALPKVVLQYDAATETGYDWAVLKGLTYQQLLGPRATAVSAVRYLHEALRRMTGRELEVVSGNDLSQ